MKILVTGGAGFIGSNIVDLYVEDGHDVTVIDDLSTGHKENVNHKAKFIEMDIRSDKLPELFSTERFDVVNHQAARGNVRRSVEAPMEYADVNVRGGINLLECSRKHGVKKVIYSSTGGCVYGEPVRIPADETHPIKPVDPYGVSKASFELYLFAYRQMYGLKYTIFRYPNVYGPRQDPFGEAGVVSIFTGQMLHGGSVTINGDGEQTRDYVYVGDVASANNLALTKGDDDVFNLGTGVETSVNMIFRDLKHILKYPKSARHGEPKPGEVRRSCLESTKARIALGWTAETHMKEGLRKTVEFFAQESVIERFKR
jgi:UDP-glucose 4-epimerase